MNTTEYVSELMERSRKAQKVLGGFDQVRLDAIVKMFAKVVYDNAEPLAKLAVEESRMGVYADKVAKNIGKSRIIWNALKGRKSVGVLAEYPEQGIIEVAKPIGVAVAVTPCTNPVVTPMCNAMFAVKCGNSLIVGPHPRGKLVAKRLKELYDPELDRLGAPRDIFLVVEEPTIEISAAIMEAADVVIATGGAGMVKAAYSSGKPSYGVGPGNVQCIFDRGIDISVEAPKALSGRIFDNGIICSGEQTIIAPEEQFDDIIAEFVKNGALYLDKKEDVDKIRAAVFPDGKMNGKLVGQSTETILKAAGIPVPEGGAKVIIVRPPVHGKGDFLSKEKMCPLMSAYPYGSFEEAIEIALDNLEVDGKGHSVSLHTNDRQHMLYAGSKLPVSRLVINQVSSTMAGGAFCNGLNPTTTLGCGTWGNNSISENFHYFHMMNKTRIAMVKPGWTQPSDEEIWG